VWCYPVQFALPCPRLPTVEFVQDKEKTYLRYRGGDPPVVISNLYFSKLEQLYRYGCADDRKFDLFLTRCYMLIKRYNAYFGNTLAGEGSQNQGGLPIPVLEALNKHFQVPHSHSVPIPVIKKILRIFFSICSLYRYRILRTNHQPCASKYFTV
jgi:phosphorylated CTD-interacting factor 1